MLAPPRFRRTADLAGNRADGGPLRTVVTLVFKYQTHSTLTNFRGVRFGRFHSSIFSRVGASSIPGMIQIDSCVSIKKPAATTQSRPASQFMCLPTHDIAL